MITASHFEGDAIVGPTFLLHIQDRISRLKPVDRRTAGKLFLEYILLKVGKIFDYCFRVRVSPSCVCTSHREFQMYDLSHCICILECREFALVF